VRGEAIVPGQPDEVVVALDLTAVRDSAQEAYDDVASRSAALDSLCGELEIAAVARSTAGVSVEQHYEYGEHGKREHRGYVASNRVLVRVADAALVSRLLKEAVSRAQASVQGPGWRVAADNPAFIEACRRAATAARRKAEAYADALGLVLGNVVEAREPRATTGPIFRGIAFARHEEEIPIDPGELDVRAALDVTFALEQP
jgi:uncharacterized protein YggE